MFKFLKQNNEYQKEACNQFLRNINGDKFFISEPCSSVLEQMLAEKNYKRDGDKFNKKYNDQVIIDKFNKTYSFN
jgi:hypothetical protein